MDDAFFRAAYAADATNRAKQSWSDYWGWVQRYYEGQTFPPIQGWRRREEDLARQHASRPEVAEALAGTGRELAAEWAKDNAVRRVSTSDLQTWGRRFGDAAKDPNALLAALAGVREEVAARQRK